jgi:hypothetical protein
VAVGQRIADEAITLVRDNGKVIPLQSSVGTPKPALPYQSVTEVSNRLVAVIFLDDLRTDSGRMLEHQILARVPDARVIYVDARSAAGMKPSVVEAVEAAEHVIAAVYVVPTAGKAMRAAGGGLKNEELKNTVAIDDATGSLLTAILDRAARRTVVLAMGNPYVVQDFPAIENYVCAFSNATVSETAAVKAIFGEIPISGHLPVTIPGIASRGDGIERPARPNLSSTQLRRFLPCSTNKTFNHKTLQPSRKIPRLTIGALFAALCVLPACSIHTNDDNKNGEKNVDIKTPVGDLHVGEQADIRDIGLTLYPGAQPAPKDNSDDKKSANVNLSVAGILVESGGRGVRLRRRSRQNHRLLRQRTAEVWQTHPVPRQVGNENELQCQCHTRQCLQAGLV